MLFLNKVPVSAAVNESVKLARKYGNPGAVRYVNAVLRNYTRRSGSVIYPDKAQDTVGYLSICYSYPKWMVEKLIDEFDEDFTEDFLSASNDIPPLTIRVNSLKTNRESLKERLEKSGIKAEDAHYMDCALNLYGVPGIDNMKEYHEGYFIVQDESSMLASVVLSPQQGETVMDVCSAPGTKSTHIAEIMGNKGQIISGDISESKLNLVRENAQRLGIKIISTLHNDASTVLDEYKSSADRLLVDAPCSGLGIMRKKPEIRWNRRGCDIDELEKIQLSILKSSSSYVKPGGILVYSTCTVLSHENIKMIREFTRQNKNFVLEDISDLIPDKLKRDSCSEGFIELYPNTDNIDGFFIARMRRVK
jgi:16S rRNA (cytosine967-C5)-methyltransferase